jgi:hypothetical protein
MGMEPRRGDGSAKYEITPGAKLREYHFGSSLRLCETISFRIP